MVWIPGTPPPPPLDYGIAWSKYLSANSIALKNAIALVCGLNPEKIYAVQRPLEFTYRLGIALKNLNERSSRICILATNDEMELTQVSLVSVIKFAKEHRWNIPAELEVFIGEADTKQLHHRNELRSKDKHPMHHPIMVAIQNTPEPKSHSMVWATLMEMARNPNLYRLTFLASAGKREAQIKYIDNKGHEQGYTLQMLRTKRNRLPKVIT
jgi:hypothetical protein